MKHKATHEASATFTVPPGVKFKQSPSYESNEHKTKTVVVTATASNEPDARALMHEALNAFIEAVATR